MTSDDIQGIKRLILFLAREMFCDFLFKFESKIFINNIIMKDIHIS